MQAIPRSFDSFVSHSNPKKTRTKLHKNIEMQKNKYLDIKRQVAQNSENFLIVVDNEEPFSQIMQKLQPRERQFKTIDPTPKSILSRQGRQQKVALTKYGSSSLESRV